MNIIIDWDPKYKQGIIKCNELDLIREHFSIENKAARFVKFKAFIPKRKYVITQNGRFDIGLLNEIITYLKSLTTPYNLVITKTFVDVYKNQYIENEDIELYKLKLELRDYQRQSVINALKKGKGVIVLPTAAGKTLTMASLVQSIRSLNKSKKTLIIVPSIQLVAQTYNDFVEYGIDEKIMTKWSGDFEPNFNASIIIAGMSILQSDKQDLSILDDINLLICDEVHKLRHDNLFNKIIKKINTFNRFGFTGTMPEDKIDQWNIIGKIGPIIYQKESLELREENYISNVFVKILLLDYKDKLKYDDVDITNPTSLYDFEYDYLQSNNFRNELITKLADSLPNNSLIMVDRIKHGELLENQLKNFSKKKIFFIRGEVELDAREEVRQIMENNNDVICVAMSKIFSTGINIKNIHFIIFTSAGQAKIKIIQSIGRGLRLHDNKLKLVIYDIADDLKYGQKHYKKRIELYDNEKISYEIKKIKE